MNRGIQRKTIVICIAMIVIGIGLFVNATARLSSIFGNEPVEFFQEHVMNGEEKDGNVEKDGNASNDSSDLEAQEVISQEKQQNLLESSEKIQYIQSHESLYPDALLELLSRNVETVDFIYDYPNLVEAGFNTMQAAEGLTLTKDETQNAHPLLLQWDKRWGAIPYGSSMIALSGCGPTCLAMAAAGLTGNADATPAAIAQYAMKQGYYVEGTGTSWALMTEGCEAYGLRGEEIGLSEEEMVQKLEEGCLLICSVSEGDFTQTGHFIVICGYEDGWFEVNDPNSVERSNAKWTYERLAGQIRNLWAMSAL